IPFGSKSIQRKLTVLVVSASLFSLGLATIGFALYERASFRSAIVRQLETLGANTAASLAFNDPKSAEEMLRALDTNPHILAAGLYDSQRNLFARYRRSDLSGDYQLPGWRAKGVEFRGTSVALFRDVTLHGERTGTMVILSDLRELENNMQEYGKIAFLVLAFSVLVTYFSTVRILRTVTHPILQLAEIAGRVAAVEDYSLRAVPGSNDEVGTLVQSFNKMLSHIQQRDRELKVMNDGLELRLNERTDELHKQKERDEKDG